MMNCYIPCDEYPAIVLENGSASCRMGFCGDDAPLTVLPNMIGQGKTQEGEERTFIGYDAQDRRELLSLRYPVERGIVTNWDDMEKIWNYAFFKDLHASPQQHPILTTEAPLNPQGNRQKMAQVMFETYDTPAFYVAFEPLLAMMSAGKVTSTVFSCGDGVTYVSPIHEGYTPSVVYRQDIGGRDLTFALQRCLHDKGYSFTTSSEIDLVREMKESMCFIAEESGNSKSSTNCNDDEQSYKLPDGTIIKLGQERRKVPEIFFQPDGVFNCGQSFSQMINQSINNCSVDVRSELFGNIVLAGGTTLMKGFGKRLQHDIAQLAPHAAHKVRVKYSPDRKYHVWCGASILGSLSTFNPLWITRQEYSEFGPSVIHRKSLS